MLLWASLAYANCEPTTAAAVQLSLDAADAALAGADSGLFLNKALEAQSQLPCITDTVSPALAAQLHRTRGVQSFLAQDTTAASRNFASAKAAQPAFALPTAVFPEGHPVQELYAAAQADGATEPMPLAAGSLRVDGTVATVRPTTRPMVLQVFTADGAVSWTGVVAQGEGLPDYDRADLTAPPEVTENLADAPAPTRQVNTTRLALAGGAAVAAAAVGTTNLLLVKKSGYLDPDQREAVLQTEGFQETTGQMARRTAGATYVLGATAIGLGVSAMISVDF